MTPEQRLRGTGKRKLTCQECRYWQPDDADAEHLAGHCRRHAPSPYGRVWPFAYAGEWCGEFEWMRLEGDGLYASAPWDVPPNEKWANYREYMAAQEVVRTAKDVVAHRLKPDPGGVIEEIEEYVRLHEALELALDKLGEASRG